MSGRSVGLDSGLSRVWITGNLSPSGRLRGTVNQTPCRYLGDACVAVVEFDGQVVFGVGAGVLVRSLEDIDGDAGAKKLRLTES